VPQTELLSIINRTEGDAYDVALVSCQLFPHQP